MADLRRAAILGGNRIPFARANGPYARPSNQDMLTAALDGLIARFERASAHRMPGTHGHTFDQPPRPRPQQLELTGVRQQLTHDGDRNDLPADLRAVEGSLVQPLGHPLLPEGVHSRF